jgi:hypothetical protein
VPNFEPRLSILTPLQQALWPLLRPAQDLGLVLYGGTAVALRCGNRASVDFDFFGPKPLNKDSLRQAMPIVQEGMVLQDEVDTLTVTTSGVKLSFFGVRFTPLAPPELTNDGVLLVASPVDLLVHKLKVILQRIEAKDYQDIDALLLHGVSLQAGLAGAQRLFGNSFQPAESLKALTYFGDGDLASVDAPTRARLRASVGPILQGDAGRPRAADAETPKQTRRKSSFGR